MLSVDQANSLPLWTKELNPIKEGKLYLEKTLLSFDIPILFVCKNEQNERYLVLCNERGKKCTRYIISKQTTSDLLDLLEDRVTISDSFLKNTIDNRAIMLFWDKETRQALPTEIRADILKDLPKEGEFLDDDGELKEYIETLQTELVSDVFK